MSAAAVEPPSASAQAAAMEEGVAAPAGVPLTDQATGRPKTASRAVAELLESGGKPVKTAVKGCRLAGCLLRVSTLVLLICAGLLFWSSSLTRSQVIMGVAIAIGICCLVGSCLSCYGAVQLVGYQMVVERVNSSLDRSARIASRVSSGDSAATIARGLAEESGVAGRVGGRFLRALGLTGKNAERATQLATELNRIRKQSQEGGAGGADTAAEGGAQPAAGESKT